MVLRRFLGVTIKETPGFIEIKGIRVHELYRAIKRKWETTRIPKNIFRVLNSSALKFSKFYAIEMWYILDELKKDTSHPRVTRKRFEEISKLLVEETWLKDIETSKKTLGFNFKKLDLFDRSKLTNGDLLPFQRAFLEAIDTEAPKLQLKGFLLDADPGTGKAQPLHSLVKIPGGWKPMGEMKVGDTVIAADGTTTEVMGVYPQGVRPCYRLTSLDGRSVECDEDHLWKVCHNSQWDIITTKELVARFNDNPNDSFFLPLCASEKGPDIDLPIDPYLFGVLLGSSLFRGQMCVHLPHRKMRQAVEEKLLIEGCQLFASPGSKNDFQIKPINPGLNPLQVKLGAYTRNVADASIPTPYLNGSHTQRLALIQGMMDTDGTWFAPSFKFETASEHVAKQMVYLIRSIGGTAKLFQRHGELRYHVWIQHPTPSHLFRHEVAQLDEIQENEKVDTYNDIKLRITGIERIDNQETQCISIAHPDHLYVTDGFVVTHNTLTGVALSLVAEATKTIVLCPRNVVKDVWVGSLGYFLKKPPKVWDSIDGDVDNIPDDCAYYITHPQQLHKLIERTDIFKRNKTVVIVDESHEYNELRSARTINLIKLCKEIKPFFVLWSSGTPIKQLGRELIPLMVTIDPLFDAKAQETFALIFGANTVQGADIVSNRLKRIRYKVEKKESVTIQATTREIKIKLPNGDDYTLDSVRKEMATFIMERFKYYEKEKGKIEADYLRIVERHRSKLFQKSDVEAFDIYVDYVRQIRTKLDLSTQKDMIVYTNIYERDKIIPNLTFEDRRIFRNAKSVYKYLPLKIRGEALGRILTQLRVDCFTDVAMEVDLPDIIDGAEKKTLIFTSYVEVLKAVEDRLINDGYKPAVIYGDTNKDLIKILERIKKDPDYNPIIATYDSLSVGVPVVEANTVVSLNTPYRDYQWNQATSRVNRYGQDTDVDIVKVTLDTGDKPNVSTRSDDIMSWSKTMVDTLMGISVDVDSLNTEDYQSEPDEKPSAQVVKTISIACF